MTSMSAAYKNLSACSVVLNTLEAVSNAGSSAPLVEPLSTAGGANVAPDQSDQSEGDDSDGELFEIEESEAPHVPLYHLRDEGAVKWALLTDLCLMLKVKSKDTLLKQVRALIPATSADLFCNAYLFSIVFRFAHRVR